jgi:hypothetical protein
MYIYIKTEQDFIFVFLRNLVGAEGIMSVGRRGASKVGTSQRTLECLVITLENGSCLKRPWNRKSGLSAGAMWTDEL